MKQIHLLILCITGILMSCRNNGQLTSDDFKWMPYKGNETLVFRSSSGDNDTIFLIGKDTTLAYPEPQAINGKIYEVVSIDSKHFRDTSLGFRYMEEAFLELSKSMNGEAELHILLNAKGGIFYRFDPIKIDTLERQTTTSISTPFADNIPVYKIFSDQVATYGDRDDFISAVYWSREKGLIRFDRKDGVYWELIKKY